MLQETPSASKIIFSFSSFSSHFQTVFTRTDRFFALYSHDLRA
jgi:hypothetical protein